MKKKYLSKIPSGIIGPIMSLITFVITYFIDPLNFGNQDSLSAIPAIMFSIVVLLIMQVIESNKEMKRGNENYHRLYEAVKDYLHVITIGNDEFAFEYVIKQLPNLSEVWNTSFNIDMELERMHEVFYDTDSYNHAMKEISTFTQTGVRWRDVGDKTAIKRFRYIDKLSDSKHYNYRIIANKVPKINFIILKYKDKKKEVLFNWDYRGIGHDPVVMLSRDKHIVDMFSIQHEHLWKFGSIDHDSIHTKSTSKK